MGHSHQVSPLSQAALSGDAALIPPLDLLLFWAAPAWLLSVSQ